MSSIREKEIEDIICEYPEYLLGKGAIILGRQVKVPNGIIDVLAWNYRTYVIEIKSCSLQEKDIGQVLRYKNDVEWFLKVAWDKVLGGCPFNQGPRTIREQAYWDEVLFMSGNEPDCSAVVPMLVGKSVDNNVLAASSGANIAIKLWEIDKEKMTVQFSNGGYSINAIDEAIQQTPEWAHRIIKLSSGWAERTSSFLLDSQIKRLFSKVEN